MDLARLRATLDDLQTCAAGDLESQTLEFKSWCDNKKDLCQELTEAVVCLANADGGHVIVGVQDRGVGVRAVSRCPHGAVTVDWIRAKLRDLTKPSVSCTVARIGDVVGNPTIPEYADLIAIEVQKTNRPGGHRTNAGVSYKRSNNECRIEYYEGDNDYSRAAIEDLRYSDLDEKAIRTAASHRELKFPGINLLRLRPIDNLLECQLLVRSDDSQFELPTIGAIILFGRSDALKKGLPNSETVLALETSINTPLTASKWLNLIDAMEAHSQWIGQQLPKMDIEFPDDVIRELLLNAYLHRCYRTQAPVQIHIRADELEIQNPGGLLGSLTIESLIHSPPIYRNFLLADSARQFGYCEKAGLGIDKVYYNLILNGFDFPKFQSINDSFSAIIRLRRDQAFADFARKSGGALQLSLTDLIVLRALRSRGRLAIGELVRLSQRSRDYMDDVLADLERRMIIKRFEEAYCLSERTLDVLAECGDKTQLSLFKSSSP